MHRAGALSLVWLALAPAVAQPQSLSLSTASASGDCTGTSFHQAADASGKYVAAEWAVAGQFPIGINRGRGRCTIRLNVAVTPGFKLVPGGGNGNANRLALAQVPYLRLNGASTGVLVESTVSIDAGAGATAAATTNGGPTNGTVLSQDRPAGSPPFESVCSTASKSAFQITAVVDVAAASNYVVPWPPEPYAQRETAAMGGYRFFYTVVPCAPTRSAAIEIPAR
jgi:hypothetical protein